MISLMISMTMRSLTRPNIPDDHSFEYDDEDLADDIDESDDFDSIRTYYHDLDKNPRLPKARISSNLRPCPHRQCLKTPIKKTIILLKRPSLRIKRLRILRIKMMRILTQRTKPSPILILKPSPILIQIQAK